MSKKLAIKGHPTRGKEVIELLEMLGGKNNCDSPADNLGLCYLIDDEFDICAHYFGYDDYENGELTIFTLEEFLEKYPYKVGDKIPDVWGDSLTVKSMSWDENYKTVMYGFEESVFIVRADEMGAENEDKTIDNTIEASQFMQLGKTVAVCFNTANYENEVELQLGDYEIVVRDGKTYAVLKKPAYPKTFEECLNMLYCKSILRTIIGHKAELLLNLEKLLICRDAYWKIAGEEMGLGKPWEPDWNDLNRKYFISLTCDGIGLYDDFRNPQVLVFPTEEMRDAFYENFKDMIESCKELL